MCESKFSLWTSKKRVNHMAIFSAILDCPIWELGIVLPAKKSTYLKNISSCFRIAQNYSKYVVRLQIQVVALF
jgi:hypothetical protein